MKASGYSLVVLVLGLVSLGCQSNQARNHELPKTLAKADHHEESQGFQTPGTDFNIDQLFDLEHFGDPPMTPLEKPWLILVYFDHLTCTTCLNQNLSLIRQMKRDLGSNTAFVAVVQGENFKFLRDLKRLGTIDYPLLIESHAGQIGLEAQFQINLIRRSDQKLLLRYLPVSGQPHLMPIFETRVRAMLEPS